MVPDTYHDFFVASAGVAGALIGLLFVAISIRSEKVSGPSADLRLQLRAGAAFSVLINPLVVSLAALMPDTDLVVAPVILALSGIASNIVMLAIMHRRLAPIGWRGIALPAALLVLYALQLGAAWKLHHNPTDVSAVKTQATLVIVFFLIGISRAWELVGARDRSLIGSLTDLRQSRAGTQTDND